MTARRFAVAPAAAVVFACLSGVAAAQPAPPPGYPSNYYRSNPTPEEEAATKALNDKQGTMNGVTATGETGSAVDAHNAQVQAQYQQELRAYQRRRDLYRRQMQEYEQRYGNPNAPGAGQP